MIEDSLRSVRSYYFSMPQWCKNLVGGVYARIPKRIALGKCYGHFMDLLKESRSWSKSQIYEYQMAQLKMTLENSYAYVPYYQRRFREYGVTPEALKSLEDLKLFPTLTKRNIKENYNDLISVKANRRGYLPTATGGSTAEPLRLLHEKGITRSKEKAFIWDGWSRVGYDPCARTVQLKGRSVAKPDMGIFWEYEPIQNFLEMDSNFLTEKNMPLYLSAIARFSPQFIIGYPSSVYLIAKYLDEHAEQKIPLPNLRAVFLAAENVYPWQRQLFERVFKCRIFSHYGHSEMVLLGMECEHSHALHFFPEYGFLEVLDSHEEPVTKQGDYGELVGTSFHNHIMPLIRYKTQDLGVIGPSVCRCGRTYPIVQDVEGRLQEFIVTSDGRLISICVMGAAHFSVLDSVYETQYYQDTPGKVLFRVVPKKGYSEEDREAILKALGDKMGAMVQVNVAEVDEIRRTRSGKHLMIEQKIPLDVLRGSQDLILKEG